MLTKREWDVRELTKQGKTIKEIAQILGISINTVRTHRANMRRKKPPRAKVQERAKDEDASVTSAEEISSE